MWMERQRNLADSIPNLRTFICQKLAFKLANKLRQISRFDIQILTTHLPAFLLPSLEIIFFLRSFSMRYLTILIEMSDSDEISVIETEGLAVIIDNINMLAELADKSAPYYANNYICH